MNKAQFRVVGLIVTATMAAAIGWSVAAGNAVIPIVAVFTGMVVFYLSKRRVREVMEDERAYTIAEKASRTTLQVFAVASALTGCVLVALSKSGYPEFGQLGLTLAFSACGLLLLYLLFYTYYGKKFGD